MFSLYLEGLTIQSVQYDQQTQGSSINFQLVSRCLVVTYFVKTYQRRVR